MIHGLPDGTRLRLRYLTEVDGSDHVAIVAVHEDDPAQLAGVGRFIRGPRHPEQAEVAITICDERQGTGLGRTIGLALAGVAKARGIRRFTASLLDTREQPIAPASLAA